MTHMRKLHWAGADLGPLPFESTFSVLLRFGSRNALNASQLQLFCNPRRHSKLPPFHLDLSWINDCRVGSNLDWIIPTQDESAFIQGIRRDDALWICNRIRYCPLCLEHGYHSYLHQLSAVERCPLHDVPLLNSCYHCNRVLPQYCFSSVIYDRPYACPNCREAFCGVNADLTLHLTFREQSNAIREAFDPVMDWWERSSKIRAKVARLWNPQAAGNPMLNGWCNVKELLRSVVLHEVPAPPSMSPASYKDISILMWKVYPWSGDQDTFFYQPRRSWSSRVAIPVSVYRTVLRGLIRWVHKHDASSTANLDLSVTNVAEFPPRSLALLCFRSQFEGKWVYPKDWMEIDYGQIQIDDEPFFQIIRYKNRTPRLAWRAFFLASYASWFFKVRQARHAKVSELKFFHKSEQESVMADQNTWVSPTAPWHGWLAFPAIENFEELLAPHVRRTVHEMHESELPLGLSNSDSGTRQTPAESSGPFLKKDMLSDDYKLILQFVRSLEEVETEGLQTMSSGSESPASIDCTGMSTTQRGYLRTLDRFLVWCAVRYHKSISSVTVEECAEFEQFLQDPQPRVFWSNDAARENWGKHWHPFRGPLSARSTAHALSVVRQMYKYLCQHGLMSSSPTINTVSTPRKPAPVDIGHRVPRSDLEFLRSQAELLPDTPASKRVRLILSLLMETAILISELANVRVKDLHQLNQGDQDNPLLSNENWFLEVNNKKSGARTIPISSKTIVYIKKHLESRGLATELDALSVQPAFLIGNPISANEIKRSVNGISKDRNLAGVNAETIRKEVKRFLSHCSRNVQSSNPSLAKILAAAGPRWLRKICISSSLESGASLLDVSETLGATVSAVAEYQATAQGSSREKRIALAALEYYRRFDPSYAKAAQPADGPQAGKILPAPPL